MQSTFKTSCFAIVLKDKVHEFLNTLKISESRLIDEFQVVDCKIEENGARVEKLS